MAAGVFGPGHLGELTQIVPFELADGVLEQTGTRERRLRLLPSRVGLYFVLGMVLFPGTGYRGVDPHRFRRHHPKWHDGLRGENRKWDRLARSTPRSIRPRLWSW